MNIALACSTSNEELQRNLKGWLGLKTTAEVYRLALATSFSQPDAPNLMQVGLVDSGGTVVKESTLFGEDEKIYLGVLKMLHRLDENTAVETITDFLRLHLNHGLQVLYTTLKGQSDAYEQMLYLLNEQSVFLPEAPTHEPEPLVPTTVDFPSYSQPIELHIGHREDEPVLFTPNSRAYNNPHMAIVGMSGSGKTYFAYSLLSQMYRRSQQQVHFLFIDYKGLSEGGQSKEQLRFREDTNLQLVDLINTPFPFNPIRSVRDPNPRKQDNQIRNFADILKDISNLGEVQRNTLIDVLKGQFDNTKDRLPTLESLHEQVKHMDRKADKLTSVLGNLCNLFEDRVEFKDFLRQNTYLSVDASLSDDARIGAVVLVLNLIMSQFSRLGEAEGTDTHAGLRYMVLIDEAHVVFKNAKALRILDDLLRVIRSKGVGIVLSSQTLSEFTRDNVGANIATAFLFDNGGVPEQTAAAFMRLKDNHRPAFRTDLQTRQPYECLANLAQHEGYLRFATRRAD